MHNICFVEFRLVATIGLLAATVLDAIAAQQNVIGGRPMPPETTFSLNELVLHALGEELAVLTGEEERAIITSFFGCWR